MTVKNLFTDPDTGATYTWHLNHGWDGDSNSGAENPLTWQTTTMGTPLPQFGERQPQTWTISGTILHREQHEAFLEWAEIGKDHTIFFKDFDSVEYEVFVQKYSWQRVGVSKNPQDPDMPYNIFRYSFEFLILGIVES